MSTPHTSDLVPSPAGKSSTFIERVDSDRTDESPFGSTLTTPVDEDVELFSGIEHRLLAKGVDSHGDGVSIYLGSQETTLDADGLLKVTQGDGKLSVGDALKAAPTPSPSLDELNVNFSPNTEVESVNARVSRRRVGSIYSQPNRPLNIAGETPDAQLEEYPFFESIPTTPGAQSSPICGTDDGPPLPDACEKPLSPSVVNMNAEDPVQTAKELFSLLPFAHNTPSLNDISLASDLLSSSLSSLSPRNLVATLLRVIFFLPWCLLAGGALLLLPGHLETLIFGPGYYPSPKGIRRFAFFSYVGSELVSTFVIVLIVFWYAFPTAGLVVTGGVAAQAIYAWQGFQLDHSVPLGEDDRQTVYLVWKQYSFVDALKGLTSSDRGFFATGADNDENAEDEDGL